jgi:hypothetical protein
MSRIDEIVNELTAEAPRFTQRPEDKAIFTLGFRAGLGVAIVELCHLAGIIPPEEAQEKANP